MIHPILYQIIRPCSYLLIKDNSNQKKMDRLLHTNYNINFSIFYSMFYK